MMGQASWLKSSRKGIGFIPPQSVPMCDCRIIGDSIFKSSADWWTRMITICCCSKRNRAMEEIHAAALSCGEINPLLLPDLVHTWINSLSTIGVTSWVGAVWNSNIQKLSLYSAVICCCCYRLPLPGVAFPWLSLSPTHMNQGNEDCCLWVNLRICSARGSRKTSRFTYCFYWSVLKVRNFCPTNTWCCG